MAGCRNQSKIRYVIALFALSLVSALQQRGFSQKYSFINYGPTAGLPGNEIRGIFQNRKGALYITTTAGISIFDGYRFKNYGFKDGIKYDYIKNFAELENGTMYLFGNTGREAYIFRNNLYKGAFSTPNVVTEYFTDKDNNGFVCTDSGLFGLTDTVFKKVELITDTAKTATPLYKYVQANDSIALVLRTYPQNRFDIINTKAKKIVFTISGFFGYHFLKDSRNRIWVCTDYLGAQMIDAETLQTPSDLFKHTPPELDKLKGIQVNYAVEDKKGNIWLATTGKGIVKVAPDGHCQYITKENGLLSNTIFRIFADRDDNIWIGTQSGLQRMLDKQMLLYDMSAGLPGDAVYDAVAVNDDLLVLSSQYHISTISQKTNKVSTYPLLHPDEGYVIRFLKKNGQLWALTPKRILKINYNLPNPIQEITPAADEIIKDFLALDDGSFITISTTKIVRYEKDRQTVLADSLPIGRTIIIDNANHLLAGTNKGLYTYSITTNGPSMTLTPLLKGSLFDKTLQIRDFEKDKQGYIWAATGEKGLYQLTLRADTVAILKKITREHGLLNDKVKDLLVTNDSTLICSTISGVCRIIFDNSGSKEIQIEKLSYLPDNCYALEKSYTDSFLLVPYLGGLILYPQKAFSTIPGSKSNAFTECYVNGKEFTGALDDGTLRFRNDENNLLFYFSPYTFSTDPYQFSYWLDNGGKENWTELGARNYVQFNNLPSGHYTLYVRMMGNNGKDILSVISKKFIVEPLWYQTLASRIIGFALALLLLLYIVGRRISNIRKNAQVKQLITETEMAALKAQMNPHFMFNCINSIDAFIHSNDKYNATLYLNKFAKLLRNILDSSKQNTVSLSKDIETLRLYIELEELRHENKFSTIFNIEEELFNSDYKVPPLIVQPFVENAILHGLKNREDESGLLQIDIRRVHDRIEYCIRDNGIGRKAAGLIAQNKESSYGLEMSYDRIRLFNNETQPSVSITDLTDAGHATGTLVVVQLKIN